jgi:ATP-dependent DNA helicase DinG
VAKGKNNYVCSKAVTAASKDSFAPVRFDAAFLKFADDSVMGSSGDKADLTCDVPQEWSQVTAEECTGKSCDLAAKCGYMKARAAMATANIVVANHSLVGMDLLLSGEVPNNNPLLKDYSALVLDEAHKAAESMRKAFSREASVLALRGLPKLIRKVKAVTFDKETFDSMEQCINNMFMLLPQLPPGESFKVIDPATISQGYKNRCITLNATRLRVTASARTLQASINEKFEAPGAKVSDEEQKTLRILRRYISTIDNVCSTMAKIAEPPEDTAVAKNEVIYLEQADNAPPRLVITPISVAPILVKKLYKTTPTVIATSATMSVAGSFRSLKEELGLETDPALERRLQSPFKYMHAAVLYCPDTIPEAPGPKDKAGMDAYGQALAKEIKQLTDITKGRAFVLFTSTAEMVKTYDYLMPLRLNLMKQDAKVTTPAAMLEWFRSEAAAGKEPVLLGLKTFWEGISVEGDDLSCVIVVKMPFPTKSEPIYNALCEKAGEEWFHKVALPQMVKDLQQGTGRLIRTTTDVGVVAILDRRMYTKQYGVSTVLPSLPFTNRTSDITEVAKRHKLLKQLRDSRVAAASIQKSA